ncbi:MAG: NirD/YgiW/YdeI family stress tolerance protein [Spirochaetaceae bacterium]|jgi:uncharacterized protein (TIGR00156 family)|nr:NirD/YgiW/YdeI family stress tolerance protein [Spirochaetaceae bacterium]
MYKNIFLYSAAFLLLSALTVSAQDGYTGPGPAENVITVEQAKALGEDAPVVLRGKIDRSLGDEKYTFSDSTGSITVEIDDHLWRGFSANQNDMVEIIGEIDRSFKKIEIEVHSIKKI